MRPFIRHSGIVVPLGRINVDTDQMVPKQFCKSLSREGYGRILFYNWRYLNGETPNPDFVMNFERYQKASILLAGSNFGCGSSREHAVWSVADYGIRVIIGPSYADIFYNNCFKNGVLPVTLSDAHMDELFRRAECIPSYQLRVNLETLSITDASGLNLIFQVDPFRRKSLLLGLDEIDLALEHEAQIAAYEEKKLPRLRAYDSGATLPS